MNFTVTVARRGIARTPKFLFHTCLLLLIAAASGAAFADTLYSDAPAYTAYAADNVSSTYSAFDPFLLGSDSTVTGFTLRLWVDPGSNPTLSFSYAISPATSSGTASSPVVSGTVTNPTLQFFRAVNGADVYDVTAAINPVDLQAGRYFLELYNGSTMFPGDSTSYPFAWDITTQNSDLGNAYGYNTGPSYFRYVVTNNLSFGTYTMSVLGTTGSPTNPASTPEPTSIAMIGSGLLALAGAMKKANR